jgi:hypothetical protein
MDGAPASSLPESGPPPASLHCGLVRETASDADTPGPGSPLAKNMPVLWVNYATPDDVLLGVRQVLQSGLRWPSVQALRVRLAKREQMFRLSTS